MSARTPSIAATARLLALAAFLVFALTGGGRIAGSDEVTMFELSRAMLHGHIDVPEGATLQGPDGRFYSKNTAGEAILAMPLVAAAEMAAKAAHFRETRAMLAARFVASFFNAVLSALLLAALYVLARRLGVRARAALAAAVLLGFTTPTWIYAKSFMAEPLESLGLLLTLGAAAMAAAGGDVDRPGTRRWLSWAALGAFLAVSAKASMLTLTLAALLALRPWRRPLRLVLPLAGIALAIAGHLAYNFARFHNALESGYGAQASTSAFSTPLVVGLYGLLVSSGKGVFWFAPALWLLPWGASEMLRRRAHGDEPRHGWAAEGAFVGAAAMWAIGLAQYATFQHWAGDGSWGPRYLVPLLPPAFLVIAFALEYGSRTVKRAAWVLAAIGLLVQIAGVGIYFGAEMREVGDYPYVRALDDPHSLESSHFNPRYSPIAEHWKILTQNTAAHLRGDLPQLGQGGPADPRLGISVGDQQVLLKAIDVWWLYARYAGIPAMPLALAALLLLAGAAIAGAATLRAANAEREIRGA